MKRLIGLSVAVLAGLTSSAWGSEFCFMNHGIHCICPPPDCPDCSCPCEHRLNLSLFGAEHATHLIAELCSDCCCDRIKAAKKLGSRLHADFCCQPEVLGALTRALLCDPCWEVRRAAAWSIALQGARTDLGVLALYISSKVDPHFLVRDKATDALDILTLCRKACFTELYVRADAVIKQLKADKYKPGVTGCVELYQHCCGTAGVVGGIPQGAVITQPAPAPMPPAQPIPKAR